MDIQTLKSNELIQFCARHPNHKLAWAEFYNRFDKTIWLFVYRECIRRGITKGSDQFEQIVQDLVQDVYIKLVEKNCKALYNFIGASENSIFTYLAIIIKNVVLNHVISMSVQKRKSKKKSMNIGEDISMIFHIMTDYLTLTSRKTF